MNQVMFMCVCANVVCRCVCLGGVGVTFTHDCTKIVINWKKIETENIGHICTLPIRNEFLCACAKHLLA